MNFNQFKKEFRANVDSLLSTSSIFEVDVVKEDIWNIYFNSYDEGERQGYNCNSCRSFIKNYGGLVVLEADLTLRSIWKMECSEPAFQKVVDALNAYVISKPIKEIFLTPTRKLGTNFNFSSEGVKWEHFFSEPRLTTKSNKDIPTLLNDSRTAHHSLRRAFKEIKTTAVVLVLELIAENALYRGAEYQGLLKAFSEAQAKYLSLPENVKDNFTWSMCTTRSAFTSIRGSVIGTLLTDLSEEGADEDRCVRSYESKVAPANFQRTSAVVTTSQVDKFKEELKAQGLEESIYRAFASPKDLNINNLLYIRDQRSIKDIFDEIAVDTKIILPSSIKPAREIKLEEFVNLVSTAKDLSIFMENAHETNLFSLIGPSNKESPSLFKWDNPFSWSYNNGMADSIRMKVKAAGGSIDGQVRVSLSWETKTDLDLHKI